MIQATAAADECINVLRVYHTRRHHCLVLQEGIISKLEHHAHRDTFCLHYLSLLGPYLTHYLPAPFQGENSLMLPVAMAKLKIMRSIMVVVLISGLSVLQFWDDFQKGFTYRKKDNVGTTGQNHTTGAHQDANPKLSDDKNKEVLPLCPMTSPLIGGPINVSFPGRLTFAKVEQKYPQVELGGHYRPHDCRARHRTAIIIPYRNRERHLKYLLYNLHPFLQRQQLDYRIYIINQAGNYTFNKARLMNAGFWEVMQEEEWECIFFHDVDLIPEDDRNNYLCGSNPKHFSVAVNKFDYKLPYQACFGGVTAFTPLQYRKINGFPNNYWGWGGEDDDIGLRVSLAGMHVIRPSMEVGRYKMIKHKRDKGNEKNNLRYKYMSDTPVMWQKDGMNTAEYEVLSRERLPLYTNITVNVGTEAGLHPPSAIPTQRPAMLPNL
ncbi:beta-1,4-galactosyltransferase 4-like isoform X2 [Nerophis lumbriciformis]|uniref:beta-1,4-galactosyltransferase 4-like isoform X2 n=1 Tax=Nerophis lumbriciformis TaxID=546530 RepID=UPI002AE08B41|nr:beta-1,4-galactosyltransferase 3-like isoform X2 [Nerophis lumbriciformis]